jgi:hypothetical protein
MISQRRPAGLGWDVFRCCLLQLLNEGDVVALKQDLAFEALAGEGRQ